MPGIVVIYHSGYGHTQRQAQAVADGAGARLIAIDADGNLPEGAWDELQAADAIVFGSPTYMGGPSWQFKKFADATSKAWFAMAWRDKLFAGFTSSASVIGDKTSTLTYFFTLAMQHGGVWVGTGMAPANARASRRDDLNWAGVWSGATATSPIDASAAEMAEGDLKFAFEFGQRVAQAAARWSREG
ncbi:flavodoxin family protein [Ramlibacter tataouinensis]|uniref:flavodoxin family protein n=1 Tax=Ramlibacter tataouinensis TaxID=94132 RepID=UPI0022F3F53F|nr:flavodoxin family protein [Ramlibacter tataouinensis]WBY01564.1 flavodoxin family protein [Ramlibacter tataouinensis]